jgi:hypothetical protein
MPTEYSYSEDAPAFLEKENEEDAAELLPREDSEASNEKP